MLQLIKQPRSLHVNKQKGYIQLCEQTKRIHTIVSHFLLLDQIFSKFQLKPCTKLFINSVMMTFT